MRRLSSFVFNKILVENNGLSKKSIILSCKKIMPFNC